MGISDYVLGKTKMSFGPDLLICQPYYKVYWGHFIVVPIIMQLLFYITRLRSPYLFLLFLIIQGNIPEIVTRREGNEPG